MKKSFVVYFLFAVAALSAVSCEEAVVPTFSGTANIYFPEPSSFVGFANTPDRTDSVINIPLRVMGLPAGTPRRYSLQVADSSTAVEGVHFSFLEEEDFTVPAGAMSDTLQVRLHKTQEMDTDTVFVAFKLESDDHLRADYRTGTTFVLYATNVLGPPPSWSDDWMGPFSAKKLFLMADLLDLDPWSFYRPLSTAEVRAYSTAMQRWLFREDEAGRTVYEEDGSTPMVMGVLAR